MKVLDYLWALASRLRHIIWVRRQRLSIRHVFLIELDSCVPVRLKEGSIYALRFAFPSE